MWTHIDCCLVWPDGHAYLFSDDEYVSYDIAGNQVDLGPAPIARDWPGLWCPVGAGVVWPNGKAYFLRGSWYVSYDIASGQADAGYPKPIAGNWPGLSFVWGVNAAVVWPVPAGVPPKAKAYLFGLVGGPGGFLHQEYVRYDIADDHQDNGYPKPIEPNWPGLKFTTPGAYVNSCVIWPNGNAYFFSYNEYVRYDIAGNQVDLGPAPIAGNWPGVPIV